MMIVGLHGWFLTYRHKRNIDWMYHIDHYGYYDAFYYESSTQL